MRRAIVAANSIDDCQHRAGVRQHDNLCATRLWYDCYHRAGVVQHDNLFARMLIQKSSYCFAELSVCEESAYFDFS